MNRGDNDVRRLAKSPRKRRQRHRTGEDSEGNRGFDELNGKKVGDPATSGT